MGQYGSVLGQYWISTGSVLGQYWISTDQYGSVRIYTDLHGSVQDQYKISTDPHPGGRDRVHSVQSLRNHYKAQADLYNSNKSVQDQYRSVHSGRISTFWQDQYRSVRDHRGASKIRCIPYINLCTDLVISRTDLVQTRADPYRSVLIHTDPY